MPQLEPTLLSLHPSDLRVPKHRLFASARIIEPFATPDATHRPRLELNFTIEGSNHIVWPKETLCASREDGLWRSTCFECFIQTTKENYIEWNFSPNGNWASYTFSKYRTDMMAAAVSPPKIQKSTASTLLAAESIPRENFSAAILLSEMEIISPLRFSLTAVVLERGVSEPFYWATRHAGTKPDFHLSDSFSLRMEF